MFVAAICINNYYFKAPKTPHEGRRGPLFVTYLSPAVSGSVLCFFPERTLESHYTGS